VALCWLNLDFFFIYFLHFFLLTGPLHAGLSPDPVSLSCFLILCWFSPLLPWPCLLTTFLAFRNAIWWSCWLSSVIFDIYSA
jgi:hypothetical protein